MGQVIDSKLIGEMPLGDGTAYGLARLVPGAIVRALLRAAAADGQRQPARASPSAAPSTASSPSTAPATSCRVRVWAFSRPSDAIQEFKIETAVYDAQIGHTGAGNVNLALKSGTNSWHGAGSFYNRDDSRSAALFASNRLGTGVTPRDYNRFSAMLSGPMFRNRTFFMGSYERLQDDTIETVHELGAHANECAAATSRSCWRLGVQIFDPATARLVNGVVTRDPFPGNIIPDNRINPIARNVLNYFPAPNQAGQADLSNNFFAEQPWTYGYNLQLTRIDHEWTPQQRTYGRFIRNFRREERYNFAGEINGVEIARGGTDRFNYNYAVGHTAVLSPSLFLDVRGSWLRFNDDLYPIGQLSPSELGYPASTLSLLGDYPHIPRFSIESGGPTTAGRRGDARRPAERLQHRPRAAVLQHAVHADVDVDARQSHVEVRLRLARAAPDGDQ